MHTSTAALAADLRGIADLAADHDWDMLRVNAMCDVSDHAYAASLDLAHVVDVLANVDPDDGATIADFCTAIRAAAALLDS